MDKTVLILTLSFLFFSSAQAEFDYNAYQASTLQHISRQSLKGLQNSEIAGIQVAMDSNKYVIPVQFIKQLRKLSADNQAVIKAWQTNLRVPDGFVELYQHEFRVDFNGQTYWVPVQESLLLPMGSELHQGDQFKLYVILIGTKGGKPVLLATQFKSDRAPP